MDPHCNVCLFVLLGFVQFECSTLSGRILTDAGNGAHIDLVPRRREQRGFEDSSRPMLQHVVAKSSRLRHYIGSVSDEGIAMEPII